MITSLMITLRPPGGPTRALSIAGIPYRVHYRVREEELQILRVYHTARMPSDISGA